MASVDKSGGGKVSSRGASVAEKTAWVRHATAGPEALAAMERLMGLGGADLGWRLEGLCVLGDDDVRLSLKNGEHRLVFHLLPVSAAGTLVQAEAFSVSVEGNAGPAVRKFLKTVASRLGARSLSHLAGMIAEDSRSFVERVTPGRPGDYVRVPCVGQPMSLLEAGWRNFFADQDFEVLLSVPTCSSSRKTVNIEYADLECYYSRPKRSFNKWTFLDWPEESVDESVPGGASGSIVTELEERDMIMGTGERADALVAEVRRQAADGKFLLFTHLCTPIIMGEDFQGLARRCEKEIGAQSVSWSQKDRDQNDNFGEHFRSVLGRTDFFDAPGDPSALNLFHFPKRCREEEIVPFLSRIGLRTNAALLPDVDFSRIEDLPKARWQIFCERSSYPTKIGDILAQSPRPVVAVRAPYGVEGTRECLKAVAAAAGKGAEFEAEWAVAMREFKPLWEAMKKESADLGLAFVVSEATLPRLLELRYGSGAPLATMVREMGFPIHLVYYDIHGEPPKLDGLEGASVSTFRSPWELQRALREGEFRAVFSDLFFDWRISRAGKARFSSRDFEMGLQGSLRTFQRLLDICRLPFYRRYAAHLRGSGGGA